MIRSIVTMTAFALPALCVGSSVAETPPLSLLEQLAAQASQIDTYSLVMRREQRHDSPDDDMEPATVLVRHRRDPACVYMRFIEKPHKGREMIYCSDRYDGKIQIHEGGLLGVVTIQIDPQKESASRGLGFRSPDEIGLFGLSRMLAATEGSTPQLSTREIGDVAAQCLHFETGPEVPRRFEVGARELCVDPSTHLPIGLRLWHPDGTLMEVATYSEIELNPEFAELEFDKDNPEYNF